MLAVHCISLKASVEKLRFI